MIRRGKSKTTVPTDEELYNLAHPKKGVNIPHLLAGNYVKELERRKENKRKSIENRMKERMERGE